jgi:hypothetical protein
MVLRILFICALSTLSVSRLPAQKKAQEELKRLVQNKFDWMIRGAYDSLAGILHDSARYIHSNGLIESKEELLASLRSRRLVLSSVRIDPATVRIWRHRRVFVVMGEGDFAGVIDRITFAVRLLFTETYYRHGRRWLLLCRQAVKL